MLQISTGKFFESADPEHLHVTTHRGILYTNYQLLCDGIATEVGALLPSVRWGDQRTVVCEVTERLPKPNGQIEHGEIASVGPDMFINDFAALVSFRLNIICTPDQALAHRLLSAQQAPLGIPALPREYIPRTFDTDVPHRETDDEELSKFVDELVALDRKHYTGAMRAIRRFVMAMHRMSDELDLAYALLVAAIESLAQEFDKFTPVWEDYAQNKRKPIDEAMKGASEDVVHRVRSAILSSEHIALGRRFLEYTLNQLQPSFFREEANQGQLPAGRSELRLALKNAYELRSGYIHALRPLPRNLAYCAHHADTEQIDTLPYLTFHGLARLARHVILNFVSNSPKMKRESFDYTSDYPNVTTGLLSPQYWLHNASLYTVESARRHLSGFLQEMGHDKSWNLTYGVSDLREVSKKIETLVGSVAKMHQKMPMLSLYVLFYHCLPLEERTEKSAFLDTNISLLNYPSIESLFVHFLINEQIPQWTIDQSDDLLREYHAQRFRKNGINAGNLLGAALTLWIAEQHRQAGNTARARILIRDAVEEYPDQKGLSELEMSLTDDALPEIQHWKFLVPRREAAREQA